MTTQPALFACPGAGPGWDQYRRARARLHSEKEQAMDLMSYRDRLVDELTGEFVLNLGHVRGEHTVNISRHMAEQVADVMLHTDVLRQIVAEASKREQLADDMLAWANHTREAYRRHNQGRAPEKPRRRPDLLWCGDGIEMAAHAVKRGYIPEEVKRRLDQQARESGAADATS